DFAYQINSGVNTVSARVGNYKTWDGDGGSNKFVGQKRIRMNINNYDCTSEWSVSEGSINTPNSDAGITLSCTIFISPYLPSSTTAVIYLEHYRFSKSSDKGYRNDIFYSEVRYSSGAG
ncbi:MAG: hypothetical protein AABX84_00710, partial [Nanoarchaeota archaeon]